MSPDVLLPASPSGLAASMAAPPQASVWIATTSATSTTKCSTESRQPRPYYRGLYERIWQLEGDELERRQNAAERSMRRLGITFNVYGDQEGQRADHSVRHLPADHRRERVAVARAGPEAADHRAQHVHRRHLPRADDRPRRRRAGVRRARPAPTLRQQCMGLKPPLGVWCHITGADLVRDRDGPVLRAGRQPALPVGRVVRAAEPAADEADVSAAVRAGSAFARWTTTAAGCSTRCRR